MDQSARPANSPVVVFTSTRSPVPMYSGTMISSPVDRRAGYIIPDLTGCYVQIIDDQPVALQLPQSVAIEVVETPPELKGGTATKRPKPARLSTGLEIMVPEYIGTGERVLVNTTTGEFAGRAD